MQTLEADGLSPYIYLTNPKGVGVILLTIHKGLARE
jgi:hypothetical protein